MQPSPLAGQEPSPGDLHEKERLEAVARYDMLDTPREEAFDRIARMLKRIFDVPVAIVSVIDNHRQWYKACLGLPNSEAALSDTFCQFAMESDEPLIVPDATLDPRFANSPFVTGGPRVRSYAGIPLRTPDGYNIGTICVIGDTPRTFSPSEIETLKDMAAIAMNEFELRRVAALDSLTGVPSRRIVMESGAREVAMAIRHHQALSAVAIDIDHFKTINDRFGHPAGDAVLVAVAAACREAVRETDIFGRIGGEEFAAILPHTERRAALEVAEKLRQAISMREFVFDGKRVQVTASFGVASLDLAARDLSVLLQHADEALYQAKREGRNRVVGWRAKEGVGPAIGRRVLKAGMILFNKRNSTIECTIRTLGDEGAGIDVSSTIGIPDRFDLSIKADSILAACRVVARSERHLDVAFD